MILIVFENLQSLAHRIFIISKMEILFAEPNPDNPW